MLVKDFLEMAKNENAMIEIHFEERQDKNTVAHITKCSEYDDLTPYMENRIMKFRTFRGLAPIYSLVQAVNEFEVKNFEKTFQLYI